MCWLLRGCQFPELLLQLYAYVPRLNNVCNAGLPDLKLGMITDPCQGKSCKNGNCVKGADGLGHLVSATRDGREQNECPR